MPGIPEQERQARGRVSNPEAYRNASKNMRRYVGVNEQGEFDPDARNMLQQGIITDERQANNNIEQIIKYLQSDRFKKWIASMIEEAIDKRVGNQNSNGGNET